MRYLIVDTNKYKFKSSNECKYVDELIKSDIVLSEQNSMAVFKEIWDKAMWARIEVDFGDADSTEDIWEQFKETL